MAGNGQAEEKSQAILPRSDKGRAEMHRIIAVVVIAVLITMLLGCFSTADALSLSPVYGSMSTGLTHSTCLFICHFTGSIISLDRQWFDYGDLLQLASIAGSWSIVVQAWMSSHSDRIGQSLGPILHRSFGSGVLVLISSASLSSAFKSFTSPRKHVLVELLTSMLFVLIERMMTARMAITIHIWNLYIGQFNPIALQLYVALMFFFISRFYPSNKPWIALLAAPALLHTFYLSPHFGTSASTNVAERSLAARDWLLVDRQWSTTGYLSVVENMRQGYRVMRCDHSLLGGEWLLTPERRKLEGWQTNEPIYSVFEMLEAVRLVETEPPIQDADASALVIGLGIGTAPKAFISHGINTTILELDPVVHRFAMEYFDLPTNHTALLRDAIEWVNRIALYPNHQTFDYLLHDVFTGGAEPLELFTFEFVTNLRELLTERGVIALNYAGDMKLPLTLQVLQTINTVFDGQCRAFRDHEASESDEDAADFANLVIFCRRDARLITFRKPKPADFLQSKSRQHYLVPRPAQEVSMPGVASGRMALLHASETQRWRAEQVESARRHWRIMRTVMPSFVWEMW